MARQGPLYSKILQHSTADFACESTITIVDGDIFRSRRDFLAEVVSAPLQVDTGDGNDNLPQMDGMKMNITFITLYETNVPYLISNRQRATVIQNSSNLLDLSNGTIALPEVVNIKIMTCAMLTSVR